DADSSSLAASRTYPIELATANSERFSAREAFQATLASILFSTWRNDECRDRHSVIVVTSASPGEGKTTAASNLAIALARIGRPVLLVDGDVRSPRLHKILSVSNEHGLTDYLKSAAAPETFIQPTCFRHLHFLASGTAKDDPTNLLHSPRLTELISSCRG